MSKRLRLSLFIIPAIVIGSVVATVFAFAAQATKAPPTTPSGKRMPAYYPNPSVVKDLPVTLDPAQFSFPQTRAAYQLAKDHPRLLLALPCGCGCDLMNGHKSLLSCYTDKHGEFCSTCQEEALLAGELYGKKVPVKEIRARIIEKFIN